MKTRIYSLMKSALAIAFVVSSFASSTAQESQEAKVTIGVELTGYTGQKMSTNGRYMVCNGGQTNMSMRAALWNLETNEVIHIASPATADDVSNDGVVVGIYEAFEVDGFKKQAAGWWKDNVWHSLGGHPDYPIEQIKQGGRATSITADGQYIAGYVFKNKTTLIPCTWKRDANGEYVFHKEYATFPNSYQGSRPYDISDNGQILVGWDSMAEGGSNWRATVWTDSDKIVRPAEVEAIYGMMMGINPEGTVAVGDMQTDGSISGVLVNIKDGSFKFFPVTLTGVASNGMVTTRNGIWTEKIGSWNLPKYLKKFWDVEIDSGYGLEAVYSISGDGQRIGGFVREGLVRIPFVVTFGKYPIAIAPDIVNTKLIGKNVAVTWEKPVYNGHEPLGYHVYRGDKKLTTTMLTELTFTDTDPELGANHYYVTVVYQYDKQVEGPKSVVSSIEVINTNGCFSPKKFGHTIQYNKTVTLTWDLPLPNYVGGESSEGNTVDGLIGYNIYRNGVKINKETITEKTFSEDITEPATYTYHVTSLFDGGCESNPSLTQTITINPLGTCNIPKSIITEIIRNNVQITWVKPTATSPHKLVGYNIYRDGTKLNSDLLANTFYTDPELAVGEYSYQLDAFYDNSCVSEKSIPIVVKIGGINTVVPPSDLEVSIDNNEATLNWSAPAIGDHALLKWSNGGAEALVGEPDGGTFYVGSKWDANDLKVYTDYTLTEVEFYSERNTPHTFSIYSGGVKVAEQHLETVIPASFNLLKLTTPVLVEKGKELMVTYKVSNKGSKDYTVGADKQHLAAGKGDLISYDGVKWESLWNDYKTSYTWAITIRLSPYSVAPAPAMVNQEMESYDKGSVEGLVIESKSVAKSIFTNKEVVGYNVYEGNKQLNTTPIPVTTYKTTVDTSSDACYSVEALFTNDRKSKRSEEQCIYGECEVATELSANTTMESIDLMWEAPTTDKIKATKLEYHAGNESGMGVAFKDAIEFHALIQATAVDLIGYDNLKLKSVEALILGECKVSLVVIQDGKKLYEKAISNVNFGEFNTFELPNGGVAIDPSKSVLIGLKIRSNPKIVTVGLDAKPTILYRGDVISLDGNKIESLSINSGGVVSGNWNISANFEQVVSSNEEITEYNIYRDGVKIDTATSTNFKDKTTEEGKEYEYYVTTSWNTGCESEASNKVKAKSNVGINDINIGEIIIYPNPANSIVNIRGEYNSLRMYNSVGIIVLHQSEKSDYINIDKLPEGIYIIELLKNDEVVNRAKIVIN